MKLETALRSPAAGRVAEVLADVNTQVEAGTKLVRIEQDPALQASAGIRQDRESEARVDLSALGGADEEERDPAAAAADALAALRSMVLGYDIDGDEAMRQLARLAAAKDALPAADPRLLARETQILRIFGDISALWRNRRVPSETQADDEAAVDVEAAHNQQEYLHAYLRTMDADLEGLPESFRIKLRRTLAHYGVTDLDPSPELGPALYRIFLAHRRAAAHVPVVAELLRSRLRDPQSLPEDARDDYRRVVDQLMSATQLRHPAVGDLARQVRYRCSDAPLLAAERVQAQQRVRAELDRLSSDPQARAAQIDAIVAAGEPILGVFTPQHHPVMLEVMTRRYYRIRPLRNVRITERSGRPLLTAEYHHDGRDYLVIAAVADSQENAGATDLRADQRAAAGPDRAPRSLRHLPDARGGRRRQPRRAGRADPRQARRHTAQRGPGRGRGAPRRRLRAGRPGLVYLPRPSGRGGGGGPDPARAASDGGRTAGPVAVLPVRADPAALRARRAPVPHPRSRGTRRSAAHGPGRRPRADHLA